MLDALSADSEVWLRWLPLIFSSLALAFTLLSFWWMNWRPGKLNIGSIRIFLAGVAHEKGTADVVIVSVPLILWNSGATPIVVSNLRLVSPDLPDLEFEGADSKIWTPITEEKIDRDYFFLPKALKPNEVIEANLVFEARNQAEFEWEAKKYDLVLEGNLLGSGKPRRFATFEFDFSNADTGKLHKLNNYFEAWPYENPGGV